MAVSFPQHAGELCPQRVVRDFDVNAIAFLDNRGTIFSFGTGVGDLSQTGVTAIINSRVIEAFGFNIDVNKTIAGLVTTIDNSVTISGPYDHCLNSALL